MESPPRAGAGDEGEGMRTLLDYLLMAFIVGVLAGAVAGWWG